MEKNIEQRIGQLEAEVGEMIALLARIAAALMHRDAYLACDDDDQILKRADLPLELGKPSLN